MRDQTAEEKENATIREDYDKENEPEEAPSEMQETKDFTDAELKNINKDIQVNF